MIRRFMPNGLFKFFLKKQIIVKPGAETSDSNSATEQYKKHLNLYNKDIENKTIFVYGYGGFGDIAVNLINEGAKKVYLYDKFENWENSHNQKLQKNYENLFTNVNDEKGPITVINNLENFLEKKDHFADIIISTSVLEHVSNIQESFSLLKKVLAPNGCQLHIVDLRDHFFKYPFEMLRFNKITWNLFLNPSSNLNRFRIKDYLKIAAEYYSNVQYKILDSNKNEFMNIENQIRSEFKSNDLDHNAATAFLLYLSNT